MAFIEGSIIGVVTPNPALHPVIFLSTSGPPPTLTTLNQWHVVDLTGTIPPDTKAVMLSGTLIITHGSASEVGDLHLYLRAYGSTDEPSYTGQVVEANVGGGSRSMYTDWVAVNGCKFEYKWTRKTMGDWPLNCAYGVNMRLVAYLRGGEPLSESGFLPAVGRQ